MSDDFTKLSNDELVDAIHYGNESYFWPEEGPAESSFWLDVLRDLHATRAEVENWKLKCELFLTGREYERNRADKSKAEVERLRATLQRIATEVRRLDEMSTTDAGEFVQMSWADTNLLEDVTDQIAALAGDVPDTEVQQ